MVSPTVARRLMRDLNELRKNPPEGIRVQTNEEDMLDVTGIIEGPEGTPYAGGYFNVKFKFTEEFPAAPPKCWFATKIFHPNVSSAGEICVNTLKKDWLSSYGIGHILVTVKCLLIYPNPESALDEEAGKLLLEDYESYCSRAKLITSVHATPRTKPAEFNESPDPESSSSAAPSETSTSTVPLGPSTSKTPPPTSTQGAASPVTVNTSSTSATPIIPPSRLIVPVSTHKLTSPVPQLYPRKVPYTTEKEGKDKDRHPSPSPLAIADANVGVHKPVTGLGVSLASNAMPTGTTKTMKRAATGSAATNAEKRKKALKRL